jgi:hypothetical protein
MSEPRSEDGVSRTVAPARRAGGLALAITFAGAMVPVAGVLLTHFQKEKEMALAAVTRSSFGGTSQHGLA